MPKKAWSRGEMEVAAAKAKVAADRTWAQGAGATCVFKGRKREDGSYDPDPEDPHILDPLTFAWHLPAGGLFNPSAITEMVDMRAIDLLARGLAPPRGWRPGGQAVEAIRAALRRAKEEHPDFSCTFLGLPRPMPALCDPGRAPPFSPEPGRFWTIQGTGRAGGREVVLLVERKEDEGRANHWWACKALRGHAGGFDKKDLELVEVDPCGRPPAKPPACPSSNEWGALRGEVALRAGRDPSEVFEPTCSRGSPPKGGRAC